MAEGVSLADRVIGGGVHDDPSSSPPPGADAPRGWTWNRASRAWQPKVRGPVVWSAPDAAPPPRERGMGVLTRLRKPAPAEEPADPGTAAAGEDHDPDPGWMEDGAQVIPIRTLRVDEETRADVKALVALAYTIPGETLPLLDPYCFAAFGEEETASGVIGAVTDIVCGSPRVAAWAASASGLMPWIKLGTALKPVAVAAFRHHVVKTVEVAVDREKREMTVTRRDFSMFTAA